MAFLHHERCPRCAELGQDQRGNNLARYTNGSAWCFSCHYMERASSFQPRAASRDSEIPNDLTVSLPPENRDWLRQYLTDAEILEHFKYSPSIKRHVFTNGKYWEARSVLGAQPKAISHGDKPYIIFGGGDPVVFVEDVVSAICVSRTATAIPLFGNSLPPDWMVRTLKFIKPERICVWLDPDMTQQSRKLTKKINSLIFERSARSIETEKDPKDYSTQEIQEILK